MAEIYEKHIGAGHVYAEGGYIGITDSTTLGKITVRTIQVVDGWIGQVVVDGKPVWETAAYEINEDDHDYSPAVAATTFAREHVTESLRTIFN